MPTCPGTTRARDPRFRVLLYCNSPPQQSDAAFLILTKLLPLVHHRWQDMLAVYLSRRIVMKTLITALAITAILATSAVADPANENRPHPTQSRPEPHLSEPQPRDPDQGFILPLPRRRGRSKFAKFDCIWCATAGNTKTATSDAGFCIGLTRTRKLRGRGCGICSPRRCLVTLQAFDANAPAPLGHPRTLEFPATLLALAGEVIQ